MNSDKYNRAILYIEDEKEIRDNYTRYLKRHFSHVYEAVDGEEGFRIYKEKKPEIIILDINLPKISGLELLRSIRKFDQVTKVIMLSAYSDTKYLLDAVELKLVKYLVKPITRKDLKLALDLALAEFVKFDIVHNESIHIKDDYTWDCKKERVYKSGTEIVFTSKEREIVKLLFSRPNYLFKYDDIITQVWNGTHEDKINPLKTLVKNIRKKLPKETIKNVFGLGYKF